MGRQPGRRIIRQDPDITELLKATLAKADLALAILITDEQGNVLAAACRR